MTIIIGLVCLSPILFLWFGLTETGERWAKPILYPAPKVDSFKPTCFLEYIYKLEEKGGLLRNYTVYENVSYESLDTVDVSAEYVKL